MTLTTSIAIGSSVAAGLALFSAALTALRLRSVKADQRVLLGEGNHADLISLAASMEQRIAAGDAARVEESVAVSARFADTEQRLCRSLSGVSLLRYDAFDEGSGQQSFSLALVDESGTGVVISSLVRRESARMYAQRVIKGQAERPLSPEEQEAVRVAALEAGGL